MKSRQAELDIERNARHIVEKGTAAAERAGTQARVSMTRVCYGAITVLGNDSPMAEDGSDISGNPH